MYNLRMLLEERKKVVIFLMLILVVVITLAVSLIPAMNYITGQDMSQQAGFVLPPVYIVLYVIFISIVGFIIATLSFVSKKLYIIKKIDESIDNIKRGKSLNSNTVPRRDELLQAYFAERIKESGMTDINKLKMFDGITQVEKDEIVGFKIDAKSPAKRSGP
nr:hypothetical protein [Candidatus Sigynarchaeota archaeon]